MSVISEMYESDQISTGPFWQISSTAGKKTSVRAARVVKSLTLSGQKQSHELKPEYSLKLCFNQKLSDEKISAEQDEEEAPELWVLDRLKFRFQ